MTDVVFLMNHNPKEDYHHWVFLLNYHDEPAYQWRDTLGRNHPHGTERWFIIRCNNTNCDARALYRVGAIEEATHTAFPVPDRMLTT